MTQPLKIVIPMAGYGSRLRPLTWSKPKPLVSLAGKTVLDYLLDMFRTVPDLDRAEFVFILGPTMGEQIREHVTRYYPHLHVDFAVQSEMKGQSDAFWQARNFLHGPMLMAFSDTLLDDINFAFLGKDKTHGIACVKPVPDPRRFGVAEVDSAGQVTRLVEKPQDIQNNLALVGCYFFPKADDLLSSIEEQFARNISLKNEFYLADAVNILLERGLKMRTEKVSVWLDAGTSEALLETNQYLLAHGRDNSSQLNQFEDTVLIPPVNIHPNARVSTSVVGPNVSIGDAAVVKGSTIQGSIISPGAHVSDCMLESSLLGHNVRISGLSGKFNLGDDSWAVS